MHYAAAKLLVNTISELSMDDCVNIYAQSIPSEPRETPMDPHQRRKQRLTDWLSRPPGSVRLILVTEAAGSHSHWRTGVPLVGQHVLDSGLLPALPRWRLKEEQAVDRKGKSVEPSDQDTPSILTWRAIEEIGALHYTLTWALVPLLPVQEIKDGTPIQLRGPTSEEINACWKYAAMIAAAHPKAIWVPTSHRVDHELQQLALSASGIRAEQIHGMQMAAWTNGDRLLAELATAYQRARRSLPHEPPAHR